MDPQLSGDFRRGVTLHAVMVLPYLSCRVKAPLWENLGSKRRGEMMRNKENERFMRKWWPKVGEWTSHSDLGLKILATLASRIPEAFEIETHEMLPVGVDWICCCSWDTVMQRNPDGTAEEASSGRNLLGCRPPEEAEPPCYYVVRCDDLPGLEACVCAKHFEQYFPQFNSASAG